MLSSVVRFSVILPVYNRAGSIATTLENILLQIRPEDEIIVVDDGSTDDLLYALGPYRKDIRIIRQQNGGPSMARNAGVRVANGNWLLFQDSDDLWTDQRVKLLLRDLREVPESVVCHVGDVVYRGKSYERSLFDLKGIEFSTNKAVIVEDALPIVISGMSLIGSAVRRDVFLRISGLDEEMRYLEDTDFFSRLALEGSFLFTGSPLAIAQRIDGDEQSATKAAEKDQKYGPQMQLRMLEKLRASSLSRTHEVLIASRVSAAEFMLAQAMAELDPAATRSLLIRSARNNPKVVRGWAKSLFAMVFGRRGFEFLSRRHRSFDRG